MRGYMSANSGVRIPMLATVLLSVDGDALAQFFARLHVWLGTQTILFEKFSIFRCKPPARQNENTGLCRLKSYHFRYDRLATLTF